MKGGVSMRVADATVKFRDEFQTQEEYDLYVVENWQKILIHNLFVLSFQINMLVGIENQREAERQKNQFGKLVLPGN